MRNILDTVTFVFVFIAMIFGLISSVFEMGIDMFKYALFGIEPSPGPDVYMSGRSSVVAKGDVSADNKCKLLVSSDKDVFDINDVTLDIEYGTFYVDAKDKYADEKYRDAYFAIYVCDHRYTERVIQTRDNYQYVPPDTYLLVDIPKGEEYNTDYAYDYSGFITYNVKYKCKKTVTIPKEVFTQREGTVNFIITGFLYYPELQINYQTMPGYSCSENFYRVELNYKITDENTVDFHFKNEDRQGIFDFYN